MSGLKRIFSAKKKEKLKSAEPSTHDAIQKLRETEEMLAKKTEYLEKKIQSETLAAKQNVAANKRPQAMQNLKRKKRLEKQLSTVDNTLSSVETQREAMENAHMGIEAVKALDYGRKAMTHAHKSVDVDDIHDMIDDIGDEMDNAKDIQDALNNNARMFGDDVDEDELNAELEMLRLEDDVDLGVSEIGGVGTSVKLPSVPTNEPSRTRKSDDKRVDDDMRALEAWAT